MTGIIHINKIGLSNTFEIKVQSPQLACSKIQELWLVIGFILYPKSTSFKNMFKNIDIF
jgi:hypothetical protein